MTSRNARANAARRDAARRRMEPVRPKWNACCIDDGELPAEALELPERQTVPQVIAAFENAIRKEQ